MAGKKNTEFKKLEDILLAELAHKDQLFHITGQFEDDHND
jgi:hypothetical protein